MFEQPFEQSLMQQPKGDANDQTRPCIKEINASPTTTLPPSVSGYGSDANRRPFLHKYLRFSSFNCNRRSLFKATMSSTVIRFAVSAIIHRSFA